MNKDRLLVVNFGGGNAGLATVGYALYNKDRTLRSASTTAGVGEVGTSTGVYAVNVMLEDGFDGIVLWTTGGATPRYTATETLAQLNAIQDETDHIRLIWNTLRLQKESIESLFKLIRERTGKSEELKSVLKGIDKLSLKEYPKLKEIKDVLKIVIPEIKLPAPIVNIPPQQEVIVPDYSQKFADLQRTLFAMTKEISSIPKQHKDYTGELLSLTDSLKTLLSNLDNKSRDILSNISPMAKSGELKSLIGNLVYELNKIKTQTNKLDIRLEAVDKNIVDNMKPAKFLQEIYSILDQAKDLKTLSEDYNRKLKSMQLAGLV